MNACVHVCAYVCMHVCVFVACVHACVYVCAHVCIHAFIHAYVCVYIHVGICACMCVCMYTCHCIYLEAKGQVSGAGCLSAIAPPGSQELDSGEDLQEVSLPTKQSHQSALQTSCTCPQPMSV